MKKIIPIYFILSICCGIHAQSWTPLSVGSASPVMRISFPTDDTGYVSLDNGTMRKTTNSGANWSTCPTISSYFTPLDFMTGTKGFCFGNTGVGMTTDGAQSWNYVLTDTVNFYYDLAVVNSSVVYAAYGNMAGDSMYLYKSTNGGTIWTLMPVTQMLMFVSDLFFLNADTGFINSGDQIMKTVDGGNSWISVYTDPMGDGITYFHSADGINIYALTQSLQVIVSSNGGNSWGAVGPGNSLPGYGINFLNGSDGFVCGGDGISSGFIEYTNNGGLTWTTAYIGNTLWCMDFPSTSRGYAAGTNGVIVRYDGGPQSTSENCVSQIQVYPNPATDFITIENAEIGSVITITNNLGQVVRSEVAQDIRMQLDIRTLAIGIYFCEIVSSTGKQVDQIVIE